MTEPRTGLTAAPRITNAWLERAEAQMASGDLSGMFVNRDDVLALVRECRRLTSSRLSLMLEVDRLAFRLGLAAARTAASGEPDEQWDLPNDLRTATNERRLVDLLLAERWADAADALVPEVAR